MRFSSQLLTTLALSALAAGPVLGQASTPIPRSPVFTTPAMSTPSTANPVTAFFYQQPVVLDRQVHRHLRLRDAGAGFARQSQAVPLLAAEFASACLEYPIVFARGSDGQWLALAVMGLREGTNAFVDAQGRWLGRYAPASIRRYPFILAEGAPAAAGKEPELSLAADLRAPHLGSRGERLFTEAGEPTELTQNALVLLGEFQAGAAATQALAQRLNDAGLLVQQNLQVRLDEQRQAALSGVWIVDEAKLRELPDAQALAFFKSGDLAAVHAHMLSLRNLPALLERTLALAPAAAPAAAATPAATPAAAPAPSTSAPAAEPAPAPAPARKGGGARKPRDS